MVHRGLSPRRIIRHMIRLFVLTALLVYLPVWGNQLQELLQTSILDGLGVDPAKVHEQYSALLVVKRDTGPEHSWWDVLGQIQAFSIEALITAVLWLVGQFASLLIFWAYIIQKFIRFTGYALSPLFIGFMAIPPLRHTGGRYLMNLVGVIVWPLGWAVAALITQGFLDFMTDPSFQFFDPTATAYTFQATLGLAAVAFWIVFSTVAAPLIIQRTLLAGALAGGELIGGAVGNVVQTGRTAVEAAATVAPAGGIVTTGAAAVVAGVLASVSTAGGRENAGSLIPAGRGLPMRRNSNSSTDDLSGDRAVREVISRSRRHLF